MRTVVTSILVISLSLMLLAVRFAGGAQAGSGAFAQPRGGNNGAGVASDKGWPRGYSLPSEAQLVIYQPQIANWENQKQLVAFAALSYVAKGEQKPALGTIKLEANTEVSLEQRLVKFSTLKITESNFPTLQKE